MVVLLEPARSAEPPHSSGSAGRDGVDRLAGGDAGGDALLVGLEGRERVGPAVGEAAGLHPVEEGAVGGRLLLPVGEVLVPRGLGGLAARDGRAGVLEDVGGHLEGLLGVEAHELLGGRDLLGAERGAVALAGVLQGRGGPGDDRAEHDEAGPVGDGLGLADRVVQRRDVLGVARLVVGPVDRLHVPAVGLVARGDVLGQRDVGVVLDRDPVGVVDQREVAELLDAGEGRRLGADALLDVTVAAQRVDVVVEGRGALGGVGVEHAALAAGGHRHAHGVADALAQRAGGGLDAGGVAELRVAGGLGAPGAQRLEVVELESPAAEVELDVERQAGVAAREHEAVAAGPVRVGGVVPHDLLEQEVRRGGEAHGRAGVAVADLLHGVHRQDADRVDGLRVEFAPVERGQSGRHGDPLGRSLAGTAEPTHAEV